MQLYHDIRIGKIAIVVQKIEEPDFIFNCKSRNGDGFIFIVDGDGVFTDNTGEYHISRNSVMILQNNSGYVFKGGKKGITYITSAFNMHPENAFRELGLPTCINAEKHPYILKQATDMLKI